MIGMVLVFIFTFSWVKHTKKKGMHFEEIAEDKNAELKDRPLPNIWLALVPMVILLVVLNFTKIGAAASLFIGCIATLVCFFKFYDIKNIFTYTFISFSDLLLGQIVVAIFLSFLHKTHPFA